MDDNNVTTLFWVEYFDAPNNYLITEDTIRNFEYIIYKDIFFII